MTKKFVPNSRDITLHHISLDLARIYVGLHNDEAEKEILEDIMTAIRNVRRHISKDENGIRHGAHEYHLIVSGEIL